MRKMLLASVAVIGMALAPFAQAAVVVGPTIGGLATFTDTTTGNHWLKLNDFFSTSGTNMIAAATAAGFTVANRADITALTNTLPLDGTFATWNTYASVMGSAPNRQLLWGAYVPDPNNNLGWAYSFSTDSSWSFVDNAFPAGGISNGAGNQFADENLWAFAGGGVPEPATWTMMLLGFGGLGAVMRRSRKRTSATA